MFDFEIVTVGIVRMFREPHKFFREIAHQEVNFVIPVIILLITGLLMSVMVFQHIPKLEKTIRESKTVHSLSFSDRIFSEKVKAWFYPVWLILFWVMFTFFFTYMISSLGGWGKATEYFKCTSFLIYPFAAFELIKFLLIAGQQITGISYLWYIYWVLLVVLLVWFTYVLIEIARFVGEIEYMNAFMAAGVPVFFMGLLWLLYSYNYIINMVIHSSTVSS